jgi:prolyl-tRNA editing enzyme YbaK/EbsC (Cys-tRNA(Pro) deacylase)
VNRFEAWLESSDTGIAVKEFPEGTRTAVDAARAVGCELGQIVKSLVFVAGGRPVVALVSGANRLDERRLSAVAGEPVLKADAETARSATGYAIGGVPPFGHATDVPVFMDRDLLVHEVVWAAAGRPDSVFEIAPGLLRDLSRATVVDLKVVTNSTSPPPLRPPPRTKGAGAPPDSGEEDLSE